MLEKKLPDCSSSNLIQEILKNGLTYRQQRTYVYKFLDKKKNT